MKLLMWYQWKGLKTEYISIMYFHKQTFKNNVFNQSLKCSYICMMYFNYIHLSLPPITLLSVPSWAPIFISFLKKTTNIKVQSMLSTCPWIRDHKASIDKLPWAMNLKGSDYPSPARFCGGLMQTVILALSWWM